jgi:hypothetical protein
MRLHAGQVWQYAGSPTEWVQKSGHRQGAWLLCACGSCVPCFSKLSRSGLFMRGRAGRELEFAKLPGGSRVLRPDAQRPAIERSERMAGVAVRR